MSDQYIKQGTGGTTEIRPCNIEINVSEEIKSGEIRTCPEGNYWAVSVRSGGIPRGYRLPNHAGEAIGGVDDLPKGTKFWAAAQSIFPRDVLPGMVLIDILTCQLVRVTAVDSTTVAGETVYGTGIQLSSTGPHATSRFRLIKNPGDGWPSEIYGRVDEIARAQDRQREVDRQRRQERLREVDRLSGMRDQMQLRDECGILESENRLLRAQVVGYEQKIKVLEDALGPTALARALKNRNLK